MRNHRKIRVGFLYCSSLIPLGLAGVSAAPAQCVPQQQAKLTGADGAPLDHFGAAVTLAGDTAIIGAYSQDDAGAVDAGVAHVFLRSPEGAWTPQGRLAAPDGLDDDYFGCSVAIDGETAVIGAYQADLGNVLNAGAAYVFVRSAGVWGYQAKLTASNGNEGDGFGFSVAADGDIAVVGAYRRDDGNRLDAGAAYVFVRSGSTWTQQARLTASDAAAYDYFGRSVAISGHTVIVGAYGVDLPGAVGAGAAYVFIGTGSVWMQQARLVAADAAGMDDFGFSVSIFGESAAVGAVYDDNAGGMNAGAAYVFVRSGALWSQQARLTAPDPAPSDLFGHAVAIGADHLVVGASQHDTPAGANTGAAYIFMREAGLWTQRGKLIAADAAASDYFGSSVALSGETALIGAASDDNSNGHDAGAAYPFRLDCTRRIPFDFDRDGDVDVRDLSRFSACATRANVPGPPPGCTPADFLISDLDGDADADLSEFAMLQRCYSGENRPAREDCTP